MTRRTISLVGVTLGLLVAPVPGHVQQRPRAPLVGFLSLASSQPDARSEVFRQGLQDFGYVEGRNIVIEFRWAGGNPDRLPGLAAELVRLKPDVIVTASTLAARAAKDATRTIPIVIAGVADPVGTGLIASLPRPGGNVTGTTFLSTELAAKRVELLKEVVPGLTRLAVLWIAPNPATEHLLKETRGAARSLGVHLELLEVRGPSEFGGAFLTMKKGGVGAVTVLPHPLMVNHRAQLAELAIKSRLPAVFEQREHAEAGGLIAYGPSWADSFRRAAYFVDRILKGAKPADLPVEQPTKFELVINLKTAKALGLKISQSVLIRADEVIR